MIANYFEVSFSNDVFAKHYVYFAKSYSKLAKSSHPLTALSILSQNKDEIIDYLDRMGDKIITINEYYFRDEYKDEVLKLLLEAYSNVQDRKSAPTFFSNLNSAFQTNGFGQDSISNFGFNLSPKEAFGYNLQEFYKEEYQNEFYYEKAYELLPDYFIERKKLESIIMVINEVIRKDYPSSINDALSTKERSQLEQLYNRPLEASAPQGEIEELILNCLDKASSGIDGYKKFIHDAGKWEGLPNKNQLIDEIINRGLDGELTRRQLLRRVNKVL